MAEINKYDDPGRNYKPQGADPSPTKDGDFWVTDATHPSGAKIFCQSGGIIYDLTTGGGSPPAGSGFFNDIGFYLGGQPTVSTYTSDGDEYNIATPGITARNSFIVTAKKDGFSGSTTTKALNCGGGAGAGSLTEIVETTYASLTGSIEAESISTGVKQAGAGETASHLFGLGGSTTDAEANRVSTVQKGDFATRTFANLGISLNVARLNLAYGLNSTETTNVGGSGGGNSRDVSTVVYGTPDTMQTDTLVLATGRGLNTSGSFDANRVLLIAGNTGATISNTVTTVDMATKTETTVGNLMSFSRARMGACNNSTETAVAGGISDGSANPADDFEHFVHATDTFVTEATLLSTNKNDPCTVQQRV